MFSKFRAFEAPKVFVFKDPDVGRVYRASNLPALLTDIKNYRIQNGLKSIEELELVVENYLCGLPEHTGKCQNNDLTRGFWVTVKGGVALLKNLAYPVKVDQKTADERASQCVSCPNNIFPDKGPFISFVDATAVAMVGDKKSKYHEQLGNCKVCTCNMRSKVFWGKPLDKFVESERVELAKVNCWQLKLSGQWDKDGNDT